METPKSLKIFMLHGALLMMGYISIRYSLALFLQENSISTSESFTIVSTAFALQVLCGFFWGILLKYTKNLSHDRLAIIGGCLAVFGMLSISYFSAFRSVILLGIALFVVGISLYLVNFQALVNAHTSDERLRTAYNQRVFLFVNTGALIGLFAGSWTMSLVSFWFPNARYPLLYLVSTIAILLALRLLVNHRSDIIKIEDKGDEAKLKNKNWPVLFGVLMVASVYLLLDFPLLARVLTVLIFIIFFSALFKLNRLTHQECVKLAMIIAGNLSYRVSIIVIYVSFSVYINHISVEDGIGKSMPGLFFYMFDPVANLAMGMVFVRYLDRLFGAKDYTHTLIGTFLLGLAFLIPLAGSLVSGSTYSIPVFAIIMTITLFGAGEFLIAPSLCAQISSLAKKPADIRYYQGVMQLSSAAGLVVGFYTISTTVTSPSHPALLNNIQLYTCQSLLLMAIFVTMCALVTYQRYSTKEVCHG